VIHFFSYVFKVALRDFLQIDMSNKHNLSPVYF